MDRHSLLPSFAALATALASPAAIAQIAAVPSVPQAVPPSDADALAAQMRIIAAEPTDVGALAQAGELSTRLGDLSGAASLFARADKVDPRNGRVKAGLAEVLLRSERPGEALRFFNQAEGYGYAAVRFAAERGLAYDLVGQQGRAQREYRLVLAAGETAEVRRRYALSLAIAGQGQAALQQLDPLIRRNDRGAWRSRAFILAMQGDVPAATTIATTMMAPGQAQGLAPFFARLASLGPVDRAFAVHFGELRPTPQRLADARLAPALAPLAPETVQVARAVPVTPPVRPIDRRRQRKGAVQLAALIPVPPPLARPPAYGTVVPTPSTTPTPTPSAVARPAAALAPVAPAATRLATTAIPTTVTPPPRASRPEIAYYVPGSLMPRHRPQPQPQPQPQPSPGPVVRTDPPIAPRATAVVVNAAPITPAPIASSVSTAAPVPPRMPATVAIESPRPPAVSPAAKPVVSPVASPTASSAANPVPAAVPVAASATVATGTPSRATLPTGGFVPISTGVGLATPPVSPSPSLTDSISTPPATPTTPSTVVSTIPTPPTPSVTAAMSPAAGSAAATAGVAAPVSTSAVLAPIAGALAVPGRELAATPGAGVPTAPIDAAPVTAAPAATPAPVSIPTPAPTPASSSVPDTPLVVNGQLTDAGRAATARRRRTVDQEVPTAAAPRAPGPVSAEKAAEPDRSARKGDRRGDTAAPDRPGAPSAPRDAASVDPAEPTSARSRRQRAADKAAAKAPTDTPTDSPVPLDRKAIARKAATERKALADKKAATEAKTLADKDAAEERKARKSKPERYWVQVAGGANEGDLSKAWSSTKAKAPALAGRKGWSTPLRATNRVITGPFKTGEEARAFINTLKKQGVSAFPFTSEVGQKITRLDAK